MAEKNVSGFQVDVQLRGDVAHIAIEMPRAEYERLMNVLNDEKAMAPICKVVDKSALGKALLGSTYCARCKNQYGEIYESHQFSAKNWASATAKAFWYCKGNHTLARGTCGSAYGSVIKH